MSLIVDILLGEDRHKFLSLPSLQQLSVTCTRYKVVYDKCLPEYLQSIKNCLLLTKFTDFYSSEIMGDMKNTIFILITPPTGKQWFKEIHEYDFYDQKCRQSLIAINTEIAQLKQVHLGKMKSVFQSDINQFLLLLDTHPIYILNIMLFLRERTVPFVNYWLIGKDRQKELDKFDKLNTPCINDLTSMIAGENKINYEINYTPEKIGYIIYDVGKLTEYYLQQEYVNLYSQEWDNYLEILIEKKKYFNGEFPELS